MKDNLKDILRERLRRWKPNFESIEGSISYLECRMFEPIQIPNTNYSISIQASPYHDCSHKDKVYDDIDIYTSFEVAFIMSYEDDYLISLDNMPLLDNYPKLNELKKYTTENIALSYVPRELVVDIYNYLIK